MDEDVPVVVIGIVASVGGEIESSKSIIFHRSEPRWWRLTYFCGKCHCIWHQLNSQYCTSPSSFDTMNGRWRHSCRIAWWTVNVDPENVSKAKQLFGERAVWYANGAKVEKTPESMRSPSKFKTQTAFHGESSDMRCESSTNEMPNRMNHARKIPSHLGRRWRGKVEPAIVNGCPSL